MVTTLTEIVLLLDTIIKIYRTCEGRLIEIKSLIYSSIDSIVIYQPNKDEDAFDVSSPCMAHNDVKTQMLVCSQKLVRTEFNQNEIINLTIL